MMMACGFVVEEDAKTAIGQARVSATTKILQGLAAVAPGGN
jgi:hypothetical protein